jgi:colicin import membrane protein
MEQAVHTETRRSGVAEVDDPFRYGWRYVRRTQPDGTTVIDEIPLTRDDLLYPEEGDFVVQEPWHTQDFTYCYSALTAWFAAQSHVVVLGDCRVDWGVPGIRPLGPDIVVLYEVPHWHRQATFHLADEGGTPVLVLEIASPGTRDNDLGIKRTFYYQAGVQKYVIVDRGPEGDDPVRLIGYQRGPAGWLPLPPDAQGCLDLAPIGLLIGIEDGRPWLYDAVTGVREPDRPEWRQTLAEARERIQDAEVRAQDAEVRAQDAEVRAQDAEVRAQDAATRATRAEARTRAEAQARMALEARVRALEEQLQRQASGGAPSPSVESQAEEPC